MLRRITIIFLVAGACDVAVEVAPTPRSLRGTEMDGALRTGVDGEFVFDAEAQAAFDYFLTAEGEMAPDELEAWVRASIDGHVPGTSRDGALTAWKKYGAYRREAAVLIEQGGDPREVERRVMSALDRELGTQPIAASERAAIARAFSRVREDQPRAWDKFLRVRHAVEEARALGATPERVHALRARELGVEAADRLAELDARRGR